jgi:hypothetical protein
MASLKITKGHPRSKATRYCSTARFVNTTSVCYALQEMLRWHILQKSDAQSKDSDGYIATPKQLRGQVLALLDGLTSAALLLI